MSGKVCPLQECHGRPRCGQCTMLDEMYPPQRNLSEATLPMARLIELETAEHERDILRTENAALKREAHTWSKAAEHYAKPLEPLDPLDVEELWDVANGDPYVDEVHQAFARLIEHKHGIGG